MQVTVTEGYRRRALTSYWQVQAEVLHLWHFFLFWIYPGGVSVVSDFFLSLGNSEVLPWKPGGHRRWTKLCFPRSMKNEFVMSNPKSVDTCQKPDGATFHIWSTKVKALSRFSWCSVDVLSAMTASSTCARTRLSRHRTSFRWAKLCGNNKSWKPSKELHFKEPKSCGLDLSSRSKGFNMWMKKPYWNYPIHCYGD